MSARLKLKNLKKRIEAIEFRALAIRVFLPKPTADFVKVEPMVPRRFF